MLTNLTNKKQQLIINQWNCPRGYKCCLGMCFTIHEKDSCDNQYSGTETEVRGILWLILTKPKCNHDSYIHYM